MTSATRRRTSCPEEARRRLSRLAGLLELADQEFMAIRVGLDQYARSLPARIEAGGDSVPLDRLSLVPLLDCAEVRDADVAIPRTRSEESWGRIRSSPTTCSGCSPRRAFAA